MSAGYRLFGIELSPYSVKVRAYLRYKGLPHVWITRNADSQEEFERHAKLPLVPLLLTPDGEALQDSTPIIELLEQRHPEPGLRPPEAISAFVSELLEEFADEWGNKWMFHLRWLREVDQWSAAHRIARLLQPRADAAAVEATASRIRERMIGRLGFVGSSPRTAPIIESSYERTLELLDAHLEGRAYVFGGRPSLADFGLFGQLYSAWTDPTAGSLLEARAPRVLEWLHRMCWPRAEGAFEDWVQVAPTLTPLLREQVCELFLPWSEANAQAIARGEDRFEVALGASVFEQRPQKYHARSLAALRQKFEVAKTDPSLCDFLRSIGGYEILAAGVG